MSRLFQTQKKYQSIHSNLYWESENWYGIGPGSVGRIWNENKRRLELNNFIRPSTWLNNIIKKKSIFKNVNIINKKTADKEILVMGLRLKKGINLKKLEDTEILRNKYFKYLLNNKF